MAFREQVTIDDLDLMVSALRAGGKTLGLVESLTLEDAELRERLVLAIAKIGVLNAISVFYRALPTAPGTYELVDRWRSIPSLPRMDLVRAFFAQQRVSLRYERTDLERWLVAAARSERMICGIRDALGHQGTGFLIGDDLVVTALHVKDQLTSVSDAVLAFDELTLLGCTVNTGVQVKLAEQQDAFRESNDELASHDVVILKTEVGVGRRSFSHYDEPRSWFPVPDFEATRVAESDVVNLLHRPSESSYLVSFGTLHEVATNASTFVYDVASSSGSSGSPVLSAQNFDVLGVHVAQLARQPPNRQAVMAEMIRRVMKDRDGFDLETPPVGVFD